MACEPLLPLYGCTYRFSDHTPSVVYCSRFDCTCVCWSANKNFSYNLYE